MRKTPLFLAFLLIILAPAGRLSAQTAGACDLAPQVAGLTAIQTDTSRDELEQLNAEIVARRKLMNAAIDCDQNDIAARVEALGRLPESIRSNPAYSKILEGLEESSQFYRAQKIDIQNLGIRDMKGSARRMAAWRQSTYLPLVTWADNFLIWADNQQFLERASGRLAQVSRVAFSLKLVNQDEINDLFERARGHFDAAFDENDKARNALNQKRPLAALVHTQSSLKSLAETYDVFFALQEALQKIVK